MVALRKRCIEPEKTGNVRTAIMGIAGEMGKMGRRGEMGINPIPPINPIMPINPITILPSRLTEIIHD